MKRKAFTLIELLVVIAIIALLLSILMPALSRVKNQAKVTLDAANLKQIGTVIKLYETDHNDKLPILFNRHTSGFRARARFSYTSVALREYVQFKSEFGEGETLGMDFDGFWDRAATQVYTLACVPEFFVCPFIRGNDREGEYADVPDTVVKGPDGEGEFDMWEKQGYTESYDTWLWAIDASKWGGLTPHPYGPEHGRPKYTVMNWYNVKWFRMNHKFPMGPGMKYARNISLSAEYNSVSDKTLLFCSQGEWGPDPDSGPNGPRRIINYQSHRKGRYGGTNTIFGDAHVEWVQGSQIGWP